LFQNPSGREKSTPPDADVGEFEADVAFEPIKGKRRGNRRALSIKFSETLILSFLPGKKL